MANRIQLEPEAQAFAEAAAKPPWLFTLGPEKGRLALDEAQSGRFASCPVDIEDLTITDGPKCALVLFASCGPRTRGLRCPSSCISMVPGGCSAARRRMTG